MDRLDGDVAGTARKGPDPHRADAPAVHERKRIIPHEHARSREFEGDLPAGKCPFGSELIYDFELQPGCV
jgi:hypothetical protein